MNIFKISIMYRKLQFVLLIQLFICQFQLFAQNDEIPISTQLNYEHLGDYSIGNFENSFLIYCPTTNRKGTGFLIESGHIITNYHVIADEKYNNIVAVSHLNQKHYFKRMEFDEDKDLAILFPVTNFEGGIKIHKAIEVNLGDDVHTFGYPLGYNGPSPILIKGSIAGYRSTEKRIEHLIVNASFNPGNSGGPLLSNDGHLIGVVVSKHAPISQKLADIIDFLKNEENGQFYLVQYMGNEFKMSQSQLIAEVLVYFREMTQTVIGEAISLKELKNFLSEKGLINLR